MRKFTTQTDQLLSKLRQPLHITYICEYILKTNSGDCRTKINDLLEQGLIKESEYGKDYFVKV